jgi:homoserine acetyltransferase
MARNRSRAPQRTQVGGLPGDLAEYPAEAEKRVRKLSRYRELWMLKTALGHDGHIVEAKVKRGVSYE